jgi:hypothetical protein
MEKMESYDSPRNNVTKNKKGSPAEYLILVLDLLIKEV